MNPATSGLVSYYPLTKGALPVVESVVPEEPATINAVSADGATLNAEIPVGSVDTSISLSLTPDIPTFGNPADFYLGDLTFSIEVFDEQGLLIGELPLNEPVLLTIHYTDEQIRIQRMHVTRKHNPALEQRHACRSGTIVEKRAQARCNTPLPRQAAEVRPDRDPLCLGQRELAQAEEGRSRLECDPVRVATPGVEHCSLAAVLGQFDQPVLDLERA